MNRRPNKARDQLRRHFNRYIRLRDYPLCFTCGKDVSKMNALGPQYVAGHFIPKNIGGDALEFHENNVHGQCQRCNRHLHGHLSMYAKRLIETYGAQIIGHLFLLYGKHWDDFTIRYYLNKYKELSTPPDTPRKGHKIAQGSHIKGEKDEDT